MTFTKLLRKMIFVVLFMILTTAMQSMAVFSPSPIGIRVGNSGSINYSLSSTMSLHVEENMIKDELGNIIYLRGFQIQGHFHNVLAGSWGGWNYYNTAIVDKVLDRLDSYGVNFVRLFTHVKGWIDNPIVSSNVPNLHLRDMLKDFLSRARNRGIYVSFTDYTVKPDPYQDPDSCGYSTWATVDERDVLTTQAAFINYVVDRTVGLGKYENYVAEFWNEPYGMSETEVIAWRSVWQSITNGIRSRGYSGLILAQCAYGLGLWAKDLAWGNLHWYYNYPLNDPLNNTIVSFHIYRSNDAGDPLSSQVNGVYSYDALKRIYDTDFHIKAISSEVPVIAGEIGGSIHAENDNRFLANSLQIFNEWGLGYSGFAYSDEVWAWQTLQEGTKLTTGGDLLQNGQVVVDAIKQGTG